MLALFAMPLSLFDAGTRLLIATLFDGRLRFFDAFAAILLILRRFVLRHYCCCRYAMRHF